MITNEMLCRQDMVEILNMAKSMDHVYNRTAKRLVEMGYDEMKFWVLCKRPELRCSPGAVRSWDVVYDNEDYGPWFSVGPAQVHYSWNDEEGENAAEAAAHLISAAPEMRSALEAFVAFFDDLSEDECLSAGLSVSVKELVEKGRAAVTKASMDTP